MNQVLKSGPQCPRTLHLLRNIILAVLHLQPSFAEIDQKHGGFLASELHARQHVVTDIHPSHPDVTLVKSRNRSSWNFPTDREQLEEEKLDDDDDDVNAREDNDNVVDDRDEYGEHGEGDFAKVLTMHQASFGRLSTQGKDPWLSHEGQSVSQKEDLVSTHADDSFKEKDLVSEKRLEQMRTKKYANVDKTCYASPDGSKDASCTQDQPCDLQTALSKYLECGIKLLPGTHHMPNTFKISITDETQKTSENFALSLMGDPGSVVSCDLANLTEFGKTAGQLDSIGHSHVDESRAFLDIQKTGSTRVLLEGFTIEKCSVGVLLEGEQMEVSTKNMIFQDNLRHVQSNPGQILSWDVENSTFFQAYLTGIMLKGKSQVVQMTNTVISGAGHTAFGMDKIINGRLDIKSSKIMGSVWSLIKIDGCTDFFVSISDSEIRDSEQSHGLVFENGKDIVLDMSRTLFTNTTAQGIRMLYLAGAIITMHEISIVESGGNAVVIQESTNARLIMDGCKIIRCYRNGLQFQKVDFFTVKIWQSVFEGNRGDAIQLTRIDQGTVDVRGTTLKKNGRDTFHLHGGEDVNVTLSKVTITESIAQALSAYDVSRVNIYMRDSILLKCFGKGITVVGAHLYLENLKFSDMVIAVDSKDGDIVGSDIRIHGCRTAIQMDGNFVKLTNVHIVDNMYGLYCEEECKKNFATQSIECTKQPLGEVSGLVYMNQKWNYETCKKITLSQPAVLLVDRDFHRKFIGGNLVLGFLCMLAAPLLQPSPPPTWATVRPLVYVVSSVGTIAWFAAFVDVVVTSIEMYKQREPEHLGKESAKQWILDHVIMVLAAYFIGACMKLALESMRHKWNALEVHARQSDAQKALKAEKEAILRRLMNPEVREFMIKGHRKGRALYHANKHAEANEVFKEMQERSKVENRSIDLMIAEFRAAYEKAPERMAFIMDIQSVTHAEPVQSDVLPTQDPEDDDGYVNYIHEQATWFKGAFFKRMEDVCKAINNLELIYQLRENPLFKKDRIESIIKKFNLPLLPEQYVLRPEAKAAYEGKFCGVCFGPVKEKERGAAKVETDYREEYKQGKKDKKPLARYVCDWLRCTIFASDPYVVGLVFALLSEVVTIIRVKNNFAGAGSEVKRTNFLINFEMQDESRTGHVGEVQLTLQDYMTIKSEQHKFYEVERAGGINEVLFKPIFE